MKPITLHPVSVLVGAALVGLSLLLSGAAQTPGVTHHPRTEVFGQIPAEWLTYVRLDPAQPYTVPLDRRFVVTFAIPNSAVLANGQSIGDSLEPVMWNYTYDKNGTRVVIPPGTLLTVTASNSDLWGYLEPVQ